MYGKTKSEVKVTKYEMPSPIKRGKSRESSRAKSRQIKNQSFRFSYKFTEDFRKLNNKTSQASR